MRPITNVPCSAMLAASLLTVPSFWLKLCLPPRCSQWQLNKPTVSSPSLMSGHVAQNLMMGTITASVIRSMAVRTTLGSCKKANQETNGLLIHPCCSFMNSISFERRHGVPFEDTAFGENWDRYSAALPEAAGFVKVLALTG